MRLRKTLALMFALLFLAGAVMPPQAMASAKRRIAILPFEYGAVSSTVGTYDVGKGIVGLLVTKLVNDGTYSVVDRQMLDSILKEQNLSVSDRADPATACKIGKILSVDAIVVGTVTQFGYETKSSSASLPTAPTMARPISDPTAASRRATSGCWAPGRRGCWPTSPGTCGPPPIPGP